MPSNNAAARPHTGRKRIDSADDVKLCADDCLVLIIGTDGTICEQLSGRASIVNHDGGSLRDHHVKDVWPTDVAQRIKQSVSRTVRARTTLRLDIRIDGVAPVHQEVLLLAHGRNRALAVCRDLTESKQLERQVRELAFSDPLTQLPNRAAFRKRIGEVISEARLRGDQLAVLRIHLDGFRYINHTFGRAIGNTLVREVARRLDAALTHGNDSVLVKNSQMSASLARTEGDEYTVLLASAKTRDEIAAAADGIIALFDQPFDVSGNALTLTPSIGAAQFPQDGGDVDGLLANADIALHEARNNGHVRRNFFTGTARVRSLSRQDLGDELSWALDNDQFSLFFQPCFDLESGRIVSAEALLRWHHPLRGIVPLTEIMPIVEMNNLGEKLVNWVLRTACAAATMLAGVGGLPISLNLSSRQAFSPQLVERVLRNTGQFELPSSSIQFEIREADFSRDSEAVENTVRMLRQRGFEVVLDDCGIGRLNIQSLLRSGVVGAKISRALIARLPHDAHGMRCSAALLSMFRELGISVSATGVETQQQSDCLAQLGCHRQQGFLLCRPVALDDLIERLAGIENPVKQVTPA